MAALEHVALRGLDLARTQSFYASLGAETCLQAEGERLTVNFGAGTRLIFDRSHTAPEVSALSYLGLELDSVDEVDDLFVRLSTQTTIHNDLRGKYRDATGPYGFFVADPDGYVLKVFKYHTAGEA